MYMIAPILLLLIFAESAVGFVHSEKMAVGIVLRVQPNSHFKSCAKDMVLYAKRKGANLLSNFSSLNLPRIARGNLFLGFGWRRLSIGNKLLYIIYKV